MGFDLGWDLVDRVEGNPLWGFVPYERQVEFLGSGDRVRAFFGGNRAGKTTVGVVGDLVDCLPVEFVPPHLVGFRRFEGPVFGRVVCPDLSATLEGVVLPKFREWCPAGALVGGSFDRAFDRQRRVLRFVNGSWVQFMTYEMDLDKFGGAALHWVHFDEEPPEDVDRECRVRLIDFGGDVRYTMTPQQGLTWMFDGVWGRRFEDGVTCVTASTLENPHVDGVEVERALAGLSVEEREARLGGRFVHLKGLVFGEFDEGRHVVGVPGREHVGGLQVVVGIDPGIRWSGVVWVGFDSDNGALVFDELLLEGATPDVVADAIRERNELWGVDPDFYVIDPSARNRSLVNAEAVEGAFARAGIFTVHGQNDVEAGVFEIKRRLQQGALQVSSGCERVLWERARYRLDDRVDGRFAVVKENDHCLDALRYVLMSRPWAFVEPVPGRRGSRFGKPVYDPLGGAVFRPSGVGSGPLGPFS